VLGAGEAVCFGLDSIKIPYLGEAGGVLLFYTIGVASFYYLGIYHIKDTNYTKNEEGAIIPNHILEGTGLTEGQHLEEIARAASLARARESGAGEKGPSEKIAANGDGV
jgi:hypothetical protein